MLIAGVLHYRQSHERLARLIDSFVSPDGNTKRVDAAVFLDGPFAGLSDIPGSGDATYRFIHERCEALGVQSTVFGPQVWSGEPAKRTAAAQAAALVDWKPLDQRRNEALGQEKWYVVIDSDEWLESDFDWALIEKHGTGTISLKNWENGDWAPSAPGDGAKMVRVMPLLPGLFWGPAHYDVRDVQTGIVFSGHEKGLSAPHDPCAVFGHDVGEKTIKAEYEAYNDGDRAAAEGKLLRVARVTPERDVFIRMDKAQFEADWIDGALVSFPGHMMPDEGGDMYGMLVGVTDTEAAGVVELEFKSLTPEEHGRISLERTQLAQLQAERDRALMERREQKRRRRAARAARRS